MKQQELAVGNHPVIDQRAHNRRFVRMPSWMIFYRFGLKKHVGMVRDLNRCGMYFYSDFVPEPGSDLEFVLRFPKWTNLGLVACKGRVVRVEQPTKGAATGVALKLTRFWPLRNGHQLRIITPARKTQISA